MTTIKFISSNLVLLKVEQLKYYNELQKIFPNIQKNITKQESPVITLLSSPHGDKRARRQFKHIKFCATITIRYDIAFESEIKKMMQLISEELNSGILLNIKNKKSL